MQPLQEALLYIRSKDFIYRAIMIFVVLFIFGYGGILLNFNTNNVLLVTLWMLSATQWIIDQWFKYKASKTNDYVNPDWDLVIHDVKALVTKESE